MTTLTKGISLCLMLATMTFAQSKFIFNINSGPAVNLGLKIDALVISIGTDFRYNYDKTESDILASEYDLFIVSPGLGLKWYLSENDVSPFLFGIISKEIPFAANVNGSLRTKDEIEDSNDDFRYVAGGGVDFCIKESLLLGFEVGASIIPRNYNLSISEHESLLISSVAHVTLTYIFK